MIDTIDTGKSKSHRSCAHAGHAATSLPPALVLQGCPFWPLLPLCSGSLQRAQAVLQTHSRGCTHSIQRERNTRHSSLLPISQNCGLPTPMCVVDLRGSDDSTHHLSAICKTAEGENLSLHFLVVHYVRPPNNPHLSCFLLTTFVISGGTGACLYCNNTFILFLQPRLITTTPLPKLTPPPPSNLLNTQPTKPGHIWNTTPLSDQSPNFHPANLSNIVARGHISRIPRFTPKLISAPNRNRVDSQRQPLHPFSKHPIRLGCRLCVGRKAAEGLRDRIIIIGAHMLPWY